MDEFIEKQAFLIDRWCSRKQLKPLRHLLNGEASLNGLTDGWEEMLTELKTIRAQNKEELKQDEFEIIVELIHVVETVLNR
jgi:hypothetical protein